MQFEGGNIINIQLILVFPNMSKRMKILCESDNDGFKLNKCGFVSITLVIFCKMRADYQNGNYINKYEQSGEEQFDSVYAHMKPIRKKL